jgi:YfiH family protein
MELIFPTWQAPNNIKAFTSTRTGGCSKAPFDSLNVGDHVGDDNNLVQENRNMLIDEACRALSFNRDIQFSPQWLKQEHTTLISTDDQPITHTACDGHFTRSKGVICTIMTADCLPVFICNRSGTEVALLHAGWRGLADGIVEKALNLFSNNPNELLVHCGPAITQRNFEVGNEVKKMIGGSDIFYKNNPNKQGHCYADLIGLLGERMEKFDIQYSHSDMCTYSDEERFFSYRRESVTGRIVSMLWIN